MILKRTLQQKTVIHWSADTSSPYLLSLLNHCDALLHQVGLESPIELAGLIRGNKLSTSLKDIDFSVATDMDPD